MHSIRPHLPLLVVVIALAAACGDEPGSAAERAVETRDSAGVAIIELESLDLGLAAVPVSEPAVDIGGVGGGAEYELYQPLSALRLDDGRIVVANQGTAEVRYYGSDGAHLRTVGREGGGPGEFQNMFGLVRLPGDSVGVWDRTAKRLTVLSDSGAVGRVVPLEHDPGFASLPAGTFPDGDLAIREGGNPAAIFAAGSGIRDDSVSILRYDLDTGALVDSLGPYPSQQNFAKMEGRGFWMQAIPFGRREHVAVADGGIHVGDDRQGEIRSYDPDGSLIRLIRIREGAGEVTAEHMRRYRERELENVEEDRLAEQRRRLEEMPFARTLPVFTSMFVDRLGRIWIQPHSDEEEGNPEWLVLDDAGAPVARVRFPRPLLPLDAGEGYMLAYTRDDMEVEHILLFPLDLQTEDA